MPEQETFFACSPNLGTLDSYTVTDHPSLKLSVVHTDCHQQPRVLSQSYLEMLGTELGNFYMQDRCSTPGEPPKGHTKARFL